jgi:hypothetical protein
MRVRAVWSGVRALTATLLLGGAMDGDELLVNVTQRGTQ